MAAQETELPTEDEAEAAADDDSGDSDGLGADADQVFGHFAQLLGLRHLRHQHAGSLSAENVGADGRVADAVLWHRPRQPR